MNWWERNLSKNLNARLIGLLMILVGTSLAIGFVSWQLRDASAINGRVQFHIGTIAIPSIFVFVGGLLFVAGKNSPRFVATRQGYPLTALQNRLAGAGVLIGITAELGFLWLIRRYGPGIWPF
jgi:hypothetical protein